MNAPYRLNMDCACSWLAVNFTASHNKQVAQGSDTVSPVMSLLRSWALKALLVGVLLDRFHVIRFIST